MIFAFPCHLEPRLLKKAVQVKMSPKLATMVEMRTPAEVMEGNGNTPDPPDRSSLCPECPLIKRSSSGSFVGNENSSSSAKCGKRSPKTNTMLINTRREASLVAMQLSNMPMETLKHAVADGDLKIDATSALVARKIMEIPSSQPTGPTFQPIDSNDVPKEAVANDATSLKALEEGFMKELMLPGKLLSKEAVTSGMSSVNCTGSAQLPLLWSINSNDITKATVAVVATS